MSEPLDILDKLADVAAEQERTESRTPEELEEAKTAVSDALYAMEDLEDGEPVYLYLSELQAIIQKQIAAFEDGTATAEPDDDVLAIVDDVEQYVDERT